MKNIFISDQSTAVNGIIPVWHSSSDGSGAGISDYLLTAVWIHRRFRSIVNRRMSKNVKTVVETSFVDQERIRKREEVYRMWGV